jgi:hypothetical protein
MIKSAPDVNDVSGVQVSDSQRRTASAGSTEQLPAPHLAKDKKPADDQSKFTQQPKTIDAQIHDLQAKYA